MTVPEGEGFPKAARLRRRREFLALSRSAERRHTRHFVILVRARGGPARLGVTVSRKVGNAVVRNRIKRCVREVFRRGPGRLLPGHDVLVIARTGADAVCFEQVRHELTAAVARPSEPQRTRA